MFTKMLKFMFCLLFFSAPVLCKPLESEPTVTKNACGISTALEKYGTNDTDRTIEGFVSRPNDWPWLISLESNVMGCSATLISDQWILTAAHCVTHPKVIVENLTAFAGSNIRLEGQELEIIKFIFHPSYSIYGGPHDIALIQISNVNFSDKIQPICLSSKVSMLPREKTIAVGWGKVWNGNNETENTGLLHEDAIPIQPWKHCIYFNETTALRDSELCAGNRMHSVYHGDSGGPLMEIINNKFYEVGITSRGTPSRDSDITDNSNFQDIFTFIPAYCDWIAETTKGDVKCEPNSNSPNVLCVVFVLFIAVFFKFMMFIG